MNQENDSSAFFYLLQDEGHGSDPVFVAPIVFRTEENIQNIKYSLLNLDLEDLSIGELIHLICKEKGLKYRIEKHAIKIYHPSSLSKKDLFRKWNEYRN